MWLYCDFALASLKGHLHLWRQAKSSRPVKSELGLNPHNIKVLPNSIYFIFGTWQSSSRDSLIYTAMWEGRTGLLMEAHWSTTKVRTGLREE